jgi:hypothetical protein
MSSNWYIARLQTRCGAWHRDRVVDMPVKPYIDIYMQEEMGPQSFDEIPEAVEIQSRRFKERKRLFSEDARGQRIFADYERGPAVVEYMEIKE